MAVRFVLSLDADVNARNDRHYTPLMVHLAGQCGVVNRSLAFVTRTQVGDAFDRRCARCTWYPS
jgi:hypothetical protein